MTYDTAKHSDDIVHGWVHRQVSWSRPHVGWVKFNCDDLVKDKDYGGVGFILRNYTSTVGILKKGVSFIVKPLL